MAKRRMERTRTETEMLLAFRLLCFIVYDERKGETREGFRRRESIFGGGGRRRRRGGRLGEFGEGELSQGRFLVEGVFQWRSIVLFGLELIL